MDEREALWDHFVELAAEGRHLDAARALEQLLGDDGLLRAARGVLLTQQGIQFLLGGATEAEPVLRAAVDTLCEVLRPDAGLGSSMTPQETDEVTVALASATSALAVCVAPTDPAGSLAHLVAELDRTADRPPSLTGELSVQAGELALQLGDQPAALRFFEVGVELCTPGRERATATIECGAAAGRSGDHTRAAALLSEAAQLHDGIGDPIGAAHARAFLVQVLVGLGREVEARDLALRTAPALDALGLDELAHAVRGLLRTLAGAHGEHDAAEAESPTGTSRLELTGEVSAAIGIGRFAEADRLLDAVEASAEPTSDVRRSGLRYLRGLVAAGLGDLGAADGHLHAAQRLCADDPTAGAQLDVSLAALDIARDHPRRGRARARAAAEVLGRADLLADKGRALLVTSQAELALGDARAAAATAREAVDVLRQGPRRELQAAAELAWASAIGVDDPHAGTEAASTALSTMDDVRHALRGTPSRAAYGARTAEAYEMALALAVRAGRHAVVAELALRAQGQVLPAPTLGLPALALAGIDRGSATPEAAAPRPIGRPGGAGLGLADDDLLPLAPPSAVSVGAPSLIAPEGRPVVDLPAIATAVTGSRSWTWWSSWAGAHHLYWALVDDDGTTTAGAIPRPTVDEAVTTLARAVGRGTEGRSSALDEPEVERALAQHLGDVLLPPPLRDRLGQAPDGDWHVVVHPASLLGGVPFGWLSGPAGTRLLEAATVHLSAPLPILADLAARAPEPPAAGAAFVVDAGGPPLFSVPPLVPTGCVLTRDDHLRWYAAGAASASGSPTVAGLRALGAGGRVGLVGYVGHVEGGTEDLPAASSVRIGDGRLSARAWIVDPGAWPPSDTCALLACSSSGLLHAEWSGLATAALWQGSRRVVSTTWDLANHPSITAHVEDLLAGLADGGDAPTVVRQLQRAALARWRADGDRDDSPLYWAPFAVSGSTASAEAGGL